MFEGPGRYVFCSLHRPGRCIDLPSEIAHKEEGRVQHFPKNGATYQQWIVEEETDNPGNYAIYSALGRSKMLGVAGNSEADLAKIRFQPPSGSPFQRWRFVAEQRPAYRIVNVATGLCIDLPEEKAAVGGDLQQRPRADVTNQLWDLNRV
jgi:hypothetical protein